MGFEPHSVAGSALKAASRLLLGGRPPRTLPTKGAHLFRNSLSWIQSYGGRRMSRVTSNVSRLTSYFSRLERGLERAMGFEPTTTSLGS